MKKAQTEILGLVAIVILILFIIVIYIMFSAKTPEKTTIKQNVVVHNLINAVLKTNPPCGQEILPTPLYRIISSCPTNPCPNEGSSCSNYVKTKLEDALGAYINELDYKLTLSNHQEDPKVNNLDIGPGTESCSKVIVDEFPISNFIAKLEICS